MRASIWLSTLQTKRRGAIGSFTASFAGGTPNRPASQHKRVGRTRNFCMSGEATDNPTGPLAPFLQTNPESSVENEGQFLRIKQPWGDSTIVLNVPLVDAALIEALNAVRLPPRFSAIWHRDRSHLEFIFTAVPIEQHLYQREFSFAFEGQTVRCHFADSSERLLAVAKASRPVEPAALTDHRHLSSYYLFQHHKLEHPDSEQAKTWRPISFWIEAPAF